MSNSRTGCAPHKRYLAATRQSRGGGVGVGVWVAPSGLGRKLMVLHLVSVGLCRELLYLGLALKCFVGNEEEV